MTLVVDTSVAVKWQVREPLTEAARELLKIEEPLIAPDWLLIEAASTFWKKVKKSELLIEHALRHLKDIPLFFERLEPAADLIEDAFKWSLRLRHSVYDCLYLVLARRENTHLVTADEKFAAILRRAGEGQSVRLLV